jgi:hypothetical protein
VDGFRAGITEVSRRAFMSRKRTPLAPKLKHLDRVGPN